jgi:hypothetical protein
MDIKWQVSGRKLHNEVDCILYFSRNIIRMTNQEIFGGPEMLHEEENEAGKQHFVFKTITWKYVHVSGKIIHFVKPWGFIFYTEWQYFGWAPPPSLSGSSILRFGLDKQNILSAGNRFLQRSSIWKTAGLPSNRTE